MADYVKKMDHGARGPRWEGASWSCSAADGPMPQDPRVSRPAQVGVPALVGVHEQGRHGVDITELLEAVELESPGELPVLLSVPRDKITILKGSGQT